MKSRFAGQKRLLAFSITIALVSFFFHPNYSLAGIPNLLSFQGRLTDSAGNLLGGSGTNHYFKFAIYDSVSAGTKLWPSGAPPSITSKVTQGVFNVLIGDTSIGFSTLDLSFDSDSYYLEVQVSDDDVTFETLAPRQRIATSGYAINAGTVHGGRFLNATGVGQFGGLATVSYSRFGADETGHGLAAASDILISGLLEANSQAFFDANASVSMSLESSALKTDTLSTSTGTLTINAFTLGGAVTGNTQTITGLGQLTVDNLRLDGNTLDTTSSTLTIAPNTANTFIIGTASVSSHFEVAGNASASKTFGSGLTDCDATVGNKALNWDVTTGIFSCTDDDTGGGSAFTGIEIGHIGDTPLAHITSLSFDPGHFTITNTASESFVRLDWDSSGGPASLSQNETVTGNWIFSAGASVSPKLEIYNTTGTASFELFSNNDPEKRFTVQSNMSGAGATDRLSILNNLNTELFTIASNGFVGIGSSSPTSIVSIRADKPVLTMRDTAASGKTYQLRNGARGPGIFDIFDPVLNETRLLVGSDGNVSIGSKSNPSNNSRVFIFGGATGANLDVRGAEGMFLDQSIIELEGNDYDVTPNSIRMQYYGSTFGFGTTLGYPNENLGVLSWQGASTAIIESGYVPLHFGTNFAERMIIDSNGFVGIGTVSPDGILEVATASAKFIVKSTGSTASASIDFLPAGGASSSNQNKFTIRAGGSPSTGGERLDVLNGAGTLLMSIASSGNVGVGTATPTTKLDVSGNASVSGNFEVGTSSTFLVQETTGKVGIGTAAPGVRLEVKDLLDGASLEVLRLNNGGTGSPGAVLTFYNNSAELGRIEGMASSLRFGTGSSGTERMRIDATGNVGINTGAATLMTRFEVQGTASASNLLTVGSLQVANGGATVSYSRFGIDATGRGLSTTDDLLISGDLEVDAKAFFDSTASVASHFEVGGYASIGGNIFTRGTITAGSSNIAVTDSTGHVQHDSIADCADGQILKWATGGGEWGCANDDLGGPTTKYLVNQHNNATTTGTEVAEMSATLTAGTYTFEYFLYAQSSATGTGIGFGINYTGTATSLVAREEYQSSASSATSGICDDVVSGAGTEFLIEGGVTRSETTTAPDLNVMTGVVTADQNCYVSIRGVIVTSGGGDIELWHNSESALTTTRVMTGSSVVITPITAGADLAEIYGTMDISIGTGDVVSLDSSLISGVKKSDKTYDRNIFGIISTSPGLVTGTVRDPGAMPVLVALSGRVPVKVNTENGPIKFGDLLTSSSTAGVAMRATKAGQIIAQAMTEFNGEGIGQVLAFVKNDYGNGSKLADIFPGLSQDGTQPSANDVDVGKLALVQFVSQKEHLAPSVDLSEIFTDRVIAGLEVISPRVVTDTFVANTIEPVDKDIELKLGEGGTFTITNNASGSFSTTFGTIASSSAVASVSSPVITFDSSGNAFFAGDVTAGSVHARQIYGLEFITGQISSLSASFEQLASSSEDAVSALTVAALEQLIANGQLNVGKLIAQDIESPGLTLLTGTVENLASVSYELGERVSGIEQALGISEDGFVNLANGLTVSGTTILNGGLEVDAIGSAEATLQILSDVVFFGRPYLNADSAGFAVIPAGAREVAVTFDREYLEQPVVSVTIALEASGSVDIESLQSKVLSEEFRSIVSKKDAKGFIIALDRPVPFDVRFSWIAFAVKNPKIFTSETFDVVEPEVLNVPASSSAVNGIGGDGEEIAPSEKPAPELSPAATPEESFISPTPELISEPTPELVPETVTEPVPEESASGPVPDTGVVSAETGEQ